MCRGPDQSLVQRDHPRQTKADGGLLMLVRAWHINLPIRLVMPRAVDRSAGVLSSYQRVITQIPCSRTQTAFYASKVCYSGLVTSRFTCEKSRSSKAVEVMIPLVLVLAWDSVRHCTFGLNMPADWLHRQACGVSLALRLNVFRSAGRCHPATWRCSASRSKTTWRPTRSNSLRLGERTPSGATDVDRHSGRLGAHGQFGHRCAGQAVSDPSRTLDAMGRKKVRYCHGDASATSRYRT